MKSLGSSAKQLRNAGWDRDLVLQLILELNKKQKRPLSAKNLYVERTPVPDISLTRIVGRPTSRQQLHHMACRYFGSWSWAMRECGLSGKGPTHNYFWNRGLITDSIRHLSRSGHPLTVKSICADRTRATTRLLEHTTHRLSTGGGLHDAARRYFGSWDAALTEAGLDIERIKEKPFWTKKKIVKVLHALNLAKIHLNSANIQCDRIKGSKIFKVIEDTTGKGRVGRSLYSCAYHSFGSWDRALREAGFSPAKIRLARFRWDRQAIRKILKALHRARVPLNVGNLSKDSSDKMRSLVIKASGRQLQGGSVYNIGRKVFGTWDEFLKYSGFTPSQIRKAAAQYIGGKEGIIDIIHSLHMNNFSLNSTAMRKKSKETQLFLEKRFGRAFSGNSIINAAKKLFGSWDKAIWEAGLNPSEFRLKSQSRTSDLPIILYQIEDMKIEGQRRRVKLMGAPPKSPDQILEEKEAFSKIETAVSGMKESDQELTERVFAAILEIHHYRDQSHLIQLVARRLDGKVSEDRISSLFKQLAKNIERGTDARV